MVEIRPEDLDLIDHNSRTPADDMIDLVEEGSNSSGPDDGDGLGTNIIPQSS